MRGYTACILASASPARAATLRQAGIDPLIRVSAAEEEAVLAGFDPAYGIQAQAKVRALAQAKADAVIPTLRIDDIRTLALRHGKPLPDHAVVVACDSMLEVGGELVGKPHSPAVARSRIRQLSGQTVTLHTGHAVVLLELTEGSVKRGAQRVDHVATQVHFTELTDAEIDAYVATGEPLEVAGSFTIDGLGGPFIAGVTGDPHSVVGISLPLLRSIVTELGVFWPSLWNCTNRAL
ncbi:MAG: Maf family protein [Actinomycetaceae bacterium]|nr:Maf family protein [Actinomycetaceae bacterium]